MKLIELQFQLTLRYVYDFFWSFKFIHNERKVYFLYIMTLFRRK